MDIKIIALLLTPPDSKEFIFYRFQIATWAQKYIRRFGEADGMLSSSDYRQLQAEYETQALVYGIMIRARKEQILDCGMEQLLRVREQRLDGPVLNM